MPDRVQFLESTYELVCKLQLPVLQAKGRDAHWALKKDKEFHFRARKAQVLVESGHV